MALEFYKPDGAKVARSLTAASMGVLLLYGAMSAHDFLAMGWWMEPLPGIGEVLSEDFPISPRTILATVMVLVSAFATYYLCNHERYVDFLIDTEAELAKVTWPTKPEVQSSTAIVILVTVLLGIYIFLVDSALIFVRNHVSLKDLFG